MVKKLLVTIEGKSYNVEVEEVGEHTPINNQPVVAPKVQAPAPATAIPQTQATKPIGNVSSEITAPMPGKIISIKVKTGQTVKEGDLLLILEAMKMENEIYSSCAGTIKEIKVTEGAVVNPGDILILM